MELRDRDRLKAPIAPGEYRQTYRAFALQGVMLNPPPGHLPRRHFELQDFPDVELRRDSLATCNVQDEDAGYGLFILNDVAEGQIISWYSKDIISKDKADKVEAKGNKHIRIVKVPGHCLNSQPLPGRDHAYYAAHHQLAGFASMLLTISSLASPTPHTASPLTLLTSGTTRFLLRSATSPPAPRFLRTTTSKRHSCVNMF